MYNDDTSRADYIQACLGDQQEPRLSRKSSCHFLLRLLPFNWVGTEILTDHMTGIIWVQLQGFENDHEWMYLTISLKSTRVWIKKVKLEARVVGRLLVSIFGHHQWVALVSIAALAVVTIVTGIVGTVFVAIHQALPLLLTSLHMICWLFEMMMKMSYEYVCGAVGVVSNPVLIRPIHFFSGSHLPNFEGTAHLHSAS